MYLGSNNWTDIGYFIRANNDIFWGLNDGYNWTPHWDSSSDMLTYLYFAIKYKLFVLLSDQIWVGTTYRFKLGSNNGTDMSWMLTSNDDELLVWVKKATENNMK